MRILGIDLGVVRTGLALSDPAGVTCRPLTTLTERSEERLIERIVSIAEEQAASLIVLGLPRPLAGGTNSQMERVLSFAARLGGHCALPVATWDERFTTKLAKQGRSPSGALDAVAACYMLQGYLDAQGDTTAEG